MVYDLSFLKNFDGNISIENIDIACLANSLEKNVSQYLYSYKLVDSDGSKELNIEISNASIPHLLGLSKNHHYGLPTYFATDIFEGLKDDWTLSNLKKADEGWYSENKYKILGVLFLYQILNLINCEAYTVKYVKGEQLAGRLKRDNIYFVIFKIGGDISYTLEMSPSKKSDSLYIPRSLRINDENIKYYSAIDLQFTGRTRIRSPKKKNKVTWTDKKE
ncbi:MAG: hypothetical protein KH542_10710 [Streptococcus sp.]|uniref:PBECR4 domain-containing protein n=1 Tax=Streptococcus TaxID=1301 RepID=UPI0025DE6C50|nr:PBECR4 domain-containing protein [Streptococcus sp.]MBS6245514.1 hypothetical protein [Streptococcus sp.]